MGEDAFGLFNAFFRLVFPEGHPIGSVRSAAPKDKKLSDLAMKVWAVATRIGLGGLGVHPI